MSFDVTFFLPDDFTDRPGEFCPHSELRSRENALIDYAEDGPHGEVPPAELVSLADWVNRHSDLLAEDPDDPPADRFLRLSGDAVPDGRQLFLGVLYSAVDRTCAAMQYRAAELGVCMVDAENTVRVNATGGAPTVVRMTDSSGALTTHVDRDSVRTVLAEDVAAHRDAGGFPFVILEPRTPGESPVPGVQFAQAAELDGEWVVEYRAGSTVYRLDGPLADVGAVAGVLGEYLDGDGDAFRGRRWSATDLVVEG